MRALVIIATSIALLTPNLEAQVTFKGSVRLREEAWSWFDRTARGEYSYTGVLGRVSANEQRRHLAWTAELAAPVLLGLPDDALAAAPAGQLGLGAAYWAANDSSTNVIGLFLKQAWVRVGVAPSLTGTSLRLGRFEFIDGSETTPGSMILATVKRERIAQRLIGNFVFSHAQRSVDGFHLSHNSTKLNATVALLRPTQGVFKVNGMRELGVTVGYAAVSTRAKVSKSDARLFAAHYRDDRAGAIPAIRITSVGGHYLRELASKDIGADILIWAVVQTGSWNGRPHRAHAFAIEGAVRSQAAFKPALRIGIDRSSGDRSPADDRHETFFQMLPTPRIYARFPFYNLMNSDDRFVSVGAAPSSKVSLRSELHVLRLSESGDGWYTGGGAFDNRVLGFSSRPSGNAKDLASVVDGSLQVQLAPTVLTTLYGARAIGHSVIERVYPAGGNGAFAYVEIEWRR